MNGGWVQTITINKNIQALNLLFTKWKWRGRRWHIFFFLLAPPGALTSIPTYLCPINTNFFRSTTLRHLWINSKNTLRNFCGNLETFYCRSKPLPCGQHMAISTWRYSQYLLKVFLSPNFATSNFAEMTPPPILHWASFPFTFRNGRPTDWAQNLWQVYPTNLFEDRFPQTTREGVPAPEKNFIPALSQNFT